MLFILLFFLEFKFNLFLLLFIKIIISLKVIFDFNYKGKRSIKVFLRGGNIKMKFIFL